MNYNELIRSSKGSEEMMWDSVANISEFLEEMKEIAPDKVRHFMEKQYESMNGQRINEWLARELVDDMWHYDAAGKMVGGETVNPGEAMDLLTGATPEKQEIHRWDAYVAANAFMHDLANTGLSKPDILKAAKQFWFNDDDMKAVNKVYWYFKNKIFG